MIRYVDEEDFKPPVLRRIAVKNLLSFGSDGIDLEMRPLNVVLGPNGSGKTNLLEILGLLTATTSGLADHVARNGGMQQWMWGGKTDTHAVLEVDVDDPVGHQLVRHRIEIGESFGSLRIYAEDLEIVGPVSTQDNNMLQDSGDAMVLSVNGAMANENVAGGPSSDSVLMNDGSYDVDPVIERIQWLYSNICIYKDAGRDVIDESRNQKPHDIGSDPTQTGTPKLTSRLSRIASSDDVGDELIEGIQNLADGLENVDFDAGNGSTRLCLREGDYVVERARISEGSIRYLCLLSILLDPEPPPVVAIEHPERGIHPDLMPYLTDLFRYAACRTQLFVTTHNDTIVDALHDNYESVVVTEKHDGQTEMSRLERSKMEIWVKDYRLGDLWSSGQLGGVRW